MARPERERSNSSLGGPPRGFSGGFLPSAAPYTIDASAAAFAFVGAWVVAQIVSSAILLTLHGTPDSDPSFGVLAVALAGAWSSYLVAMWLLSRRAGTGSVISDYGLSAQPADLLGLGVGALAQLVLIRAIYLPLEAVWPETFSEDRLTENAQDLVDQASEGSTWLLVLVVVIGAPLIEELFYRGLLQRSLAARFAHVPVVIGVAALFAVIHLRPAEIPGLFAVGLLFGWAALRWDRLGPAIMIHVGFNLTGLLLVL